MKKIYLLTIILFVLCAYTGYAQVLNQSGNIHRNATPNKAHIDPSNGQAWWGYFIDDGQYGDFGTELASTYNCAIYIPSNHEVAKDSKIYAERLWLKRNAHMSDIKIWLSTELPATAEEANICCKPVTTNKGGVVDFEFDEPYQMEGQGVYVGYTFTISTVEDDDDKWPVQTTVGLDMIQNALFVKYGANWMSNFDLCNNYGGNWGNLAMQVLLGDGFYANAAAVSEVGTGVVAIGNTVDVPVTVENFGGQDITEFDYVVSYDGAESEVLHFDTGEKPIIGTLNSQVYNIPLTAGNVTGESKATVKIVKVNGVENELADGREQAEASVVTVAKRVVRRTVMENFLNTNDDGYAVLSHVANDRLGYDWHDGVTYASQECGGNHNNYIGIMIHDRDAFCTNDYINTCLQLDSLKEVTQLPFIFTDVDRENRILNYFGSQYFDQYNRRTKFGVEDDFAVSQRKDVEAEVEISTTWNDDDHTTIRSIVSTTFQYSTDDAHYALAFALTEDGKHGSINNYILPMTKQGGMFQWDPLIWDTYVNGPNVIEDVTFNDVLVAADEIYHGIEGSIESEIVEGETQYYLHKWNLSYNTSIENKDNLKVIVMLLDTKSGRIVNANRVHVGEDSEEVGIENVIPASAEGNAMMYDLMGRRVNDSYKGIIIIDGKKFFKK